MTVVEDVVQKIKYEYFGSISHSNENNDEYVKHQIQEE